ncbi:MAG: hypothetical protein WBO10_03155 [Pyrinomonadaceae bacterium]
MRRTVNISMSEDMYSFIRVRIRDRFHSSVSEYIRALIRADKGNDRAVEPTPHRKLRRANDAFDSLLDLRDL